MEAAAPLPVLPPQDLGEICEDEKAAQIVEFLTGLLRHMGSEAQVKVYRNEEGRYKAVLEGEKLGALIGRRGETVVLRSIFRYSDSSVEVMSLENSPT